MLNNFSRSFWSRRKNSGNLGDVHIFAHSAAWIPSLDHGRRTARRRWPTCLCWGSLTLDTFQTSYKSVNQQHRGHTSRTLQMRFRSRPNPLSTSFQSGFGFAGWRRPRFKSQHSHRSQYSRMCTIFSMRNIGSQAMRDWKIVRPIIGWHKAQCTWYFSSESRPKRRGQSRSSFQTSSQLHKPQCIPSLVSITSLSTGSTILSCKWNSTLEFWKCSTSSGTASYPSLAAEKFCAQGWWVLIITFH